MSNVIHLFSRRVKNEEGASEFGKLSNAAIQMNLPFAVPPIAYVFSGDAGASSEDFHQFLDSKGVAAFFDLRFSPRLDFIAATRKSALEILKELKIDYFDVFGRSGISSPLAAFDDRLEILKEIVVVVENSLKNGESCLMAFDHDYLVGEYEKAMGQYFDVVRIGGRYIQEVAVEANRLKM